MMSMNIVLIGKPGCGKGTLANVLKKDNWYQLSPGDLMREKMKDNDETAELLKSLLNKGNFAPDELTIQIVKNKIAQLPQGTNVLFDGFPRTVAQAKMLKDSFDIDLIIHFDISDDLIIERITNRMVHPPSGRVYNKLFNPPRVDGIDDYTGDKLVQRDDDKPELISQRIKNFMELTYPAFEYLQSSGIDVLNVDGAKSSSEIANTVQLSLMSIAQYSAHKVVSKKSSI